MNERARPLLSLYTLDRPALQSFSRELRDLLHRDDREALAKALGLGAELSARLAAGPRAVDWFLRSDVDAEAAPLFASLRRVAKKRALTLAWTSAEPSLEGRLRAFDLLRDDARVAGLIDKLLDAVRLPWFLLRTGATSGWLDAARREDLTNGMRRLRPSLPGELAAFADALADLDGDIVAHDLL